MKVAVVFEISDDVIPSKCLVNYEVLEMAQIGGGLISDYREILNVVCSPLRRLPLKKHMKRGVTESDYVKGWNDCLRKVTGETK